MTVADIHFGYDQHRFYRLFPHMKLELYLTRFHAVTRREVNLACLRLSIDPRCRNDMGIMLGFEDLHMQILSLWHRNKQYLHGVEEHLLSLKSQVEFVRLDHCLNVSSILPVCSAGRQ